VGDLIQRSGKCPAKWAYVVSLEREFHKLSSDANMRRYGRLCGTENLKQIRALFHAPLDYVVWLTGTSMPPEDALERLSSGWAGVAGWGCDN